MTLTSKYQLAYDVAKSIKTTDAEGNEVWNHPLLRSLALRAMLDYIKENPDADLRKYGRSLFDIKGMKNSDRREGDAARDAFDAFEDVRDRFFSLLADRNNPNIKWVQNVGYVFQLPKRVEDMTKEEYDHARNVALGKE